VPCQHCQRTFFSQRIDEHEQICQTRNHPRQTFNSKNHRLKGLDVLPPAEGQATRKNRWKTQHEQFIISIRNVRKGKPASRAEMRDEYSDYVLCQFCGRRFESGVADRHIPNCKNIIHRPKPPPKPDEPKQNEPKQNRR
jgi:hypothetical protein